MSACLLIADVQYGFVNTHTQHVPSLVEALQASYDVVIATRFFNEDASFFRTLIGWNRLARDSREFELAFEPRADAWIIDKPIYTCVDKLLLARLHTRSITQVDVCGIDTDICVTKCAVDLFEAGIEPRVLAGYSASTAGPQAHEQALRTLGRYIGRNQVIP